MRLDERLLVPSHKDGRAEGGVFSFIARCDDIQAMLAERYGRDNLCLKVFRRELEPGQPATSLPWGKGVTLGQATRAQNVFAWHGLAPRVVDVVGINGTRAAQVTEYVEDDGQEFDRQTAGDTMRRACVRAQTHDMNPNNWVGSQMVDFQYCYLPDTEYRERLRERAYKYAAWGSRSEPYQPVPELNLPGQRDPEQVIGLMGLRDMDWHGKTVLDIGCNLGTLGRWLSRQGVKRYTGVDLPHVAETAFEINNWLGYWNLDFVGASLPGERERLAGPYDVVFALSCQQVKPLPWAARLAREAFYLEGHVPDKEETYRPQLEGLFGSVDYLGMSRDHGPRPVFRCEP